MIKKHTRIIRLQQSSIKQEKMSELMNQLQETLNFIKGKIGTSTRIGIVLGSGLGNLAEVIKVNVSIPYADIPNFQTSTVKGHGGRLILGELGGVNVLVMSGRFHYYEGYTPEQVVLPIRVMKLLGVETVLLSNAAGGVNPAFKVGDLMIINDHISFFTANPLMGKNIEELGTRFPDMSEPYSHAIIDKALAICQQNNIHIHQGVYTAVTGPTFETHAEYRLIKALGSDVVGMSTVQETIAAVHCGMTVFAVSVVTDLGIRDSNNVITHEEVLQAAKEAEPKLTLLFTELVKVI